jgi:hypothetical protein
MNFDAFKILHFAGMFFLFSSLGALLLRAMQKGNPQFAERKLLFLTHGLSLLLILVSGLGLLVTLGMAHPLPVWAWGKLIIWLALGASGGMVLRKQQQACLLWWVLPILGVLAAILGHYKP